MKLRLIEISQDIHPKLSKRTTIFTRVRVEASRTETALAVRGLITVVSTIPFVCSLDNFEAMIYLTEKGVQAIIGDTPDLEKEEKIRLVMSKQIKEIYRQRLIYLRKALIVQEVQLSTIRARVNQLNLVEAKLLEKLATQQTEYTK